jgi:4-hydroxy-2-oxoheptanedioate aldolase
VPSIENHFKRRLKGADPLVGLWMQLTSNVAAESLAYSGFDWLLIDSEHAPNEVQDVLGQLQGVAAGASSPIVRIAWNDAVLFKRLLDAGVQTFLVPQVNSAEEAKKAVRAVRYPPRGVRGVAGCTRANRFAHVPNYYKVADEEICMIVQVETRAAAAQVREIAAVDGIDAVFVGPADLAADMGHLGDPGHPEIQAAIAGTLAGAQSAGKPAGIFAFGPDDARRRFASGFRFASVGSDLATMIKACEALLIVARAKD